MSIFYSAKLVNTVSTLKNVNAMVTDNTNLYISTNDNNAGIIIIPISNPNNYNVLDLSYTGNNIKDIAYYNGYIYYITDLTVYKYSLTTTTNVSTSPNLNRGEILQNMCINSKNGNIYVIQQTINGTPSLDYFISYKQGTPNILLNNKSLINGIYPTSPSTLTQDMVLATIGITSITTDNTNLYMLGTIYDRDNAYGQQITLNSNTVLLYFPDIDTLNFDNCLLYILDTVNILYSKILYNNGFLYFTRNANLNSSNYIVKTNLTGNIINSTSYLGGKSKYGGGMTFDSNGNFYVTFDQISIYPGLTSILATLVPPCFKSGTLILTNKGYFPVESLRAGYLIQTYKDGFVPIHKIGKKEIYHLAENSRIKSQLYRCSQDKYPELFEDLIITGCHSILVDSFESEEQRNKTIEINNDAYVTDGKLRLPACVDDKTSVYEKEGTYTIYHFALENDNYYANYGVYANGLLVETCSKRYITELANMDIV